MKFKNTLKSIFDEFSTEIYCLRETGDLDDELYEATFEYLINTGNIPYGVAEERTGDPYEFVSEFLLKGYSNIKNVSEHI
jgi:hypothetical protein